MHRALPRFRKTSIGEHRISDRCDDAQFHCAEKDTLTPSAYLNGMSRIQRRIARNSSTAHHCSPLPHLASEEYYAAAQIKASCDPRVALVALAKASGPKRLTF
jgi:hypothetical protein